MLLWLGHLGSPGVIVAKSTVYRLAHVGTYSWEKVYISKIKFKIPGRIDRKVVEIKKSQGPASYQASAHNQTLPLVVPMLL